MPPFASGGLAVSLLAAVVLWLAPTAPPTASYPDHPIPGHSGGFGEPTCQTCHFDNDLNDPNGYLRLEGLDGDIEAGTSNPVIVTLRHPELVIAGFQASFRHTDGSQAGALSSSDDRTLVTKLNGVTYIQHTLAGTKVGDDQVATWTFDWAVPETEGPVWLHVTANAANGDRSEFGDFVYADSLLFEVSPVD